MMVACVLVMISEQGKKFKNGFKMLLKQRMSHILKIINLLVLAENRFKNHLINQMAMPWEWFGLVITLVQNVAPLYLQQALAIDIESSKIDCLRFVVCPLLAQLITHFFSSFSAAAIHSTNEAKKAGGMCH